MRARDEHAKAAFEPIVGDPSFVRSFGVFVTPDHDRFDALATVDGESFDVEDRQRHTAQLYDLAKQPKAAVCGGIFLRGRWPGSVRIGRTKLINELVVVATGRRSPCIPDCSQTLAECWATHPAASNSRGFRTRQTSREGEGAWWGRHGRRYGQPIPILSNVLIEAVEDRVTLTAKDDTHATGPDPRGRDEGIRAIMRVEKIPVTGFKVNR